MKVKFLEPVKSGGRCFQPGDVAFINDKDAEGLLAVGACESVERLSQSPFRITLNHEEHKQ